MYESSNSISTRKKRSCLTTGHLTVAEKQNILNMCEKIRFSIPAMRTTHIVSSIVEAIGVSRSTVYRVLTEYKNSGNLSSPKKSTGRPSIVDTFDERVKNSVRRIAHSLSSKKELTLDKIMQKIKKRDDLPKMSRSTLHKLMCQINAKRFKRKRKEVEKLNDTSVPDMDVGNVDCSRAAMKMDKSLDIKLEQEELVIKDEVIEITDDKNSSSEIINYNTNSSKTGIGDLLASTEREDSDDSKSLETKPEPEFIIVKEEPDQVVEFQEVEDCTAEQSSNSKGTFKCKICRRWVPLNSLTNHMLCHKKVKCNSTWHETIFGQNGSLQKLKQIQPTEKAYKCLECQKCFTHSSYLQRHINSGCKKLFKCQLCDETFIQGRDLKKHTVLHEEMHFTCTQWKKDVSCKKNLLVHEHGRPLKCQRCHRVYMNNGSLLNHLLLHECKKPVICTDVVSFLPEIPIQIDLS